eukprot:3667673-Amphidinium_carterae.3
MLHLHSTHGATAIDVASEGPPPAEEEELEQQRQREDERPEIVSLPRRTDSEPEPALSSGLLTPANRSMDRTAPPSELDEQPPLKALRLSAEQPSASEERGNDVVTQAQSSTEGAPRPRSRSPRALDSSTQPWLRLTQEERQERLRELERLPMCLRPPDQQEEAENHLVCFNPKFREQERKRAESAGEVRLDDLSPEVREQFIGESGADQAKWYRILKTNPQALIMHHGKAVAALRSQWPDRVIGSRMVRRLKPQRGIGSAPKPKSRFCVLGHQDPDTAFLRVYAPTPAVEVMMVYNTPCIGSSQHRSSSTSRCWT